MDEPARPLLVLGAGGDLTNRLLLPALGELLKVEPERRVHVVGVGADELDQAAWQDRVRQAFGDPDTGAAAEAVETSTWLTADVTTADGLRAALGACTGAPAVYFALPPAVTVRACAELARIGVPEGTTLALEKPFGTDAHTARELNELLTRIVPERSVHRVDHFLGRTTVLNLLGWRFANRVFEPLWSRDHVESVEIVYDEQLGLENRAGYYDRAGALVDMVQSHLLQVLALVAMEPPSTIGERDLRDGKGLVLRATHVWRGDPVAASRRARYAAGRVGERQLPAYADEPGVDAGRGTETLAEVVVEVRTGRWAGVPFRLRSGKALGARCREVRVQFRPPAHVPEGLLGAAPGNVLHIALGPEHASLEINVNGPGDPDTLSPEVMEADFDAGRLPAYGEVLRGVLDRDPALSIRGDNAEECWRIVQPVLDAWRAGEVALEEYPAGSAGPW